MKTIQHPGKGNNQFLSPIGTHHIFSGRHLAPDLHKAVIFYCAAPHAMTVALAGDFNHWQPAPMERCVDGWWRAHVDLCRGEHRYYFLVDGQAMLDPNSSAIVATEHAEKASFIAV